jgi:hypothetical protein
MPNLDPRRLINWNLVSHPLNWVIILLMLVIAGGVGHYALSLAGIQPSKSGSNTKGKNTYGSLPAGQVPADDAVSAINPASAGLTS